MSNKYAEAGVNLEAGYKAVERIKKHVSKTSRLGVLGALGGFGGMFDLSSLNLSEPVLVSGTDGVGTKLMVAQHLSKHDTIGIDLVAMCVNDVLAVGAEPLFFLDYIAIGKNKPELIEEIVAGVATGCQIANCALVGGETAEMPDMYDSDDYDVAGFSVGAVEKSKIITGADIKVKDKLIGLVSSGIHSNGYSLVRKILFKDNDINLLEYQEMLGSSVAEAILKPTTIYVKPVLELLKEVEVKGISHITGGGFDENLPRMLKGNLGCQIDLGSWPILPIFNYLQKLSNIELREMFKIFNMGVGMVLVVAEKDVEKTLKLLEKQGQKSYLIGEITDQLGVSIDG
ncbi:MAG: phosphoribosylformylglycinamidine cyclo-ligase [Erysipelotrichaceae bacterium]